MKFYSFCLSVFFIYLPQHLSYSSFLQTKLLNPTQSQNGGGDQMYDRIQQAAEHIFLPFPHKMSFFEHQNPYAIYPIPQDKLKAKMKENEKIDRDHNIYQQALDKALTKSMSSLSQKIKYSNIKKINHEDNLFEFKLNPHIGIESENDKTISEILQKSEALSKENDQGKTGKMTDYARNEFKNAEKQLEDNGNLTIGEQISLYDIQKLNLNLSEEYLNQNIMRESSYLDSSESVVVEKEGDNLKQLRSILENRTLIGENHTQQQSMDEGNSYSGLQSMFPGDTTIKEFKNKTYYNGWIHPHEISYFDKLYMDGYYDDLMNK